MRTHRTMFFALLAIFGLMSFSAAPLLAGETKTEKIDVNNASAEEIKALPGIGDAYSKKIVEGRPFKTTDDIVKAGVPKGTVDKIKDSIVFGEYKKEVVAKVPPKKGMVWVNKETKIFHREDDRWYGKTKEGEFMDEADAVKAGYRASK